MSEQKFSVNLMKDAKFTKGVLRDYFEDRELGISEATGGKYMAVVHRACGPCPPGGSGNHTHTLDFQMNYILKGWMRVLFADEGKEITFEVGDSWIQPPEIQHDVLDFSPDLEVLEITSPAEFPTTEVPR